MNWKNSTSGTLFGSAILLLHRRIACVRALADGKHGALNALDSTFATVRQLYDPIEGLESGDLSPNLLTDLLQYESASH